MAVSRCLVECLGFMHFQSIGPLSTCPSVCVFTFEVPFKHLFAPTSQSRMSNIFRDSESLGKSNGKKWSQIGTFLFGCGLKSPKKKKKNTDFALQNKVETTLPMDQRPLVKGCIANFGICQFFFSFCVLDDFFLFYKQFRFWGILGPPGNHASQWIRDLWSKGVSLIFAYSQMFLSFCVLDSFFSIFQKKWVLGYSWSTLLWYRCNYPHRSRDALSPVCGIFVNLLQPRIDCLVFREYLIALFLNLES